MPGNPVLAPINYDTLSEIDKKRASDAVSIVKEKINGKTKARSYANGSKQKYTY